jgi:hypothetical protein
MKLGRRKAGTCHQLFTLHCRRPYRHCQAQQWANSRISKTDAIWQLTGLKLTSALSARRVFAAGMFNRGELGNAYRVKNGGQ